MPCSPSTGHFPVAASRTAVFVAGLRDIAPFARPNAGFEWYNYYDKDDLLGYPLRPLTRAGKRPYEGLVTGDIAVRAGFGPLGSHLNYLERGRVVAAIASRIGRLALSGSVDAG